MTRLKSLLTIASGILFVVTIDTANAGGSHSRSNCEQRIFQKDERFACFVNRDDFFYFARNPQTEALLVPAPTSNIQMATSLTDNKYSCDCQLRRRYDVICAGNDTSLIAGTDRRGRWISGEVLHRGDQAKFTARRAPVEDCEPILK